MGWPRQNELLRLYEDKPPGAYMMLDAERFLSRHDWLYEGIVNVYDGPEPRLGSGSASVGYIASNRLKRVQWDELPEIWQRAFQRWLDYDEIKPEDVRGFWRIGCQPPHPSKELQLCTQIQQPGGDTARR